MGIPSFYRRLSVVHKGLICKQPTRKSAALYFDFNCLIYHVARNSNMPQYTPLTHAVWEKTLLEKINEYVVYIWRQTGEPSEVFLAVDGVVPLAKIKQQRLRRFKSAWLVEEERRLGLREDAGSSWDTNSITPGTAFMDKLGQSLRSLCLQRGGGWSVSSANEPGEGEQKLMKILRSKESYDGSLLIYGLDADLILLSLLNGVGRGIQDCYLVREDEEFGKQKRAPGERETYSYFSLTTLAESLWSDFSSLTPQQKTQRIRNYVAGMSLLGNDFLPHGLSLRVKEDGHEILAKNLFDLEQEGLSLTEQKDGRWVFCLATLQRLLSLWADYEEDAILTTIRKKLLLRNTANQVDAKQVFENKPLEWSVEQEAVTWIKQQDTGKHRLTFKSNWRHLYATKWNKQMPISTLCQHYLFGLQWVLDYYTGQVPIPTTWMYPTSLPPFWSDLVTYLKKNPSIPCLALPTYSLEPQQQLAMVLPLSSWYLLRNKSLKQLPLLYPQFWPTGFGFFSVGKSRLWECEPEICHLPLSVVFEKPLN